MPSAFWICLVVTLLRLAGSPAVVPRRRQRRTRSSRRPAARRASGRPPLSGVREVTTKHRRAARQVTPFGLNPPTGLADGLARRPALRRRHDGDSPREPDHGSIGSPAPLRTDQRELGSYDGDNVHVAVTQTIVRVPARLERQGCTNAQFASSGARFRSSSEPCPASAETNAAGDALRPARAGSRRRCARSIRNAQSELCSASSSRRARSDGSAPSAASSALRWVQASSAAAPGAQVAPAAPARRRRVAAPARRRPTATGDDVGQLQHRLQERDALVPVVAEQLGVEGDDRAPSGACATKSRGVGARPLRGALGVVERAVVGPQRVGAGGEPVGVAVVAVRRIAATRATRGRSPCGRAGRGRCPRRSPGPRATAVTSVQSTHVMCTPASSSSSSSHGACAHSGSQKPPSQAPKRRRCDAIPVSSCSRTPASVASSGSTAWVAALVQRDVRGEGGDQVAAALERLRRGLVPRGRVRDLPGRLRVLGRVEPVRRGPHLAQERQAALERARRLELVGEHRGDRERDLARDARRARPAAAGSWSRSPPTATPRRTATSRSPRRRACGCAGRCSAASWAQHGEQVEARVQAGAAQREVARADRRREAVVERLA